jgi:transmembrane sensor
MTEQYIEELMQKYAEGTATPREVQQLMDWYHAVPIGDVPWPADDAREKEKVQQRMLQRLQNTLPGKKGRLYWLTPFRTAAAVLIIVLAAALFYYWPSTPVSYATITNPSGRIRQVQLPDGSTVWLNAASTLKYVSDFSNHRQLKLDGEAFFDVTHDAKHPFSVEAGGVQVTVLGTRFNIAGYGTANRTTVSLLKGKVRVSAEEKELAVLQPATQLEWDRQSRTAITKSIDTTAIVAWKAGRLQFQGQTLGEIMQALERWYGVRARFASPSLGQCRYYMSFDSAMPLKDILSLMMEITGMHLALDRQTIIISGKGCQ